MGFLPFIPILVVVFYLVVICAILFLIYTWVNKFISLKQEHNHLLGEILKKMGDK
jgi:phosphotransferase system  glucose/maltose/N-acetylglucosamine-specific IIC component